MDHSFYQERLSAFADRELPPDEAARVEEHLTNCDECCRRLEELSRLDRLVYDASRFDDTDYWESAAQKIEAKLESEPAPVTDIRPERKGIYSGLWWKLPAIAASVLVVGYIGLHQSDIIQDDMMIPPDSQSAPAQPVEVEAEPPESQPTSDYLQSREADSYRADETEPESVTPVAEATQDVDVLRSEVDRSVETEEAEARQDIPTGIPEPKSIKEEGLEVAIPDEGAAGRTAPQPTMLTAPAEGTADAEAKPVIAEDEQSTVVERTSRTKRRGRRPAATSAEQKVAEDDETEQRLEEVSLQTVVPPPPEEELPSDQRRLTEQEYNEVKKVFGEDQRMFDADKAAKMPEPTKELETLRHTRDSLQTVLAKLTDTTESSTARRLFGMAGKQALSPTTTNNLAPKRPNKEVEQVTEILLDVWYRICRTTEDSRERRRGLDFISDLAHDPLSDLNEKAGRYLDSLDRQ